MRLFRQPKKWYKIGDYLFNFEEIVFIEITPAGEYQISIDGHDGVVVISGPDDKQKFRQEFKKHCVKVGDEIIGL